jgi:hypothetical protein
MGAAQAQDAPHEQAAQQKPRTVADTDPAAAYGGVEKISRMMLDKMAAANATPTLRGSGPYSAKLEINLAYPNATLYRPADLQSLGSKKLGLLVWGNGGCTSDGSSAAAHLAEIASHGYLAIAPGKPMTGPAAPPGARAPAIMTSSVEDLRNIMSWALAENERQGSPYFHRIDPRMIAVSGTSCGGMQAIILGQDPRVSAVIIHNSGLFPILPDLNPLMIDPERVQGLHTPVLFITGGKIDLAHPFAIAAYDKIMRQPAMLASIEVGHSGTFADPHGGAAAKVALDWLEWRLRGNVEASRTFVGADCRLCADPKWTIIKKNMR